MHIQQSEHGVSNSLERDNPFCKRNALFCVTHFVWEGKDHPFFLLLSSNRKKCRRDQVLVAKHDSLSLTPLRSRSLTFHLRAQQETLFRSLKRFKSVHFSQDDRKGRLLRFSTSFHNPVHLSFANRFQFFNSNRWRYHRMVNSTKIGKMREKHDGKQ